MKLTWRMILRCYFILQELQVNLKVLGTGSDSKSTIPEMNFTWVLRHTVSAIFQLMILLLLASFITNLITVQSPVILWLLLGKYMTRLTQINWEKDQCLHTLLRFKIILLMKTRFKDTCSVEISSLP